MKVMYLDESGDHSLTVIDPSYPVFVLGGIIVDDEYATGPMADSIRQFKWDVFRRDDLILHTADIVRNKNGFEQLKETPFRDRFYHALNELMQTLEY